jgi:hypothetical protein
METQNLKTKIIEIAQNTILKKGSATLNHLYYEIVMCSIEQGFSTELFSQYSVEVIADILCIPHTKHYKTIKI